MRSSSLFISVVGFFLAFSLLTGCKAQDSPTTRLAHFYALLTPSVKAAFERGDLEATAQFLTERLEAAPDPFTNQANERFWRGYSALEEEMTFSERYQLIKDLEAITFFTPSQTTEYFYRYFYKRNN